MAVNLPKNKKSLKELIALVDANPERFNMLQDVLWFRNKWLPENLHVYRQFEKYAEELLLRGRRDYYSVWMIGNRLRWDTLFQEVDSAYKISNNSFAYISRLLMLDHIRLSGMFRVKDNLK